ncbi:MAG: glycosyltransferase family 1 protein [Gammaproteobacteria bacterium PRO9]|nr:glycosyltransferase family 1 protein [Gammaproteobacteria bacterium PRO9]
MPTAVGVRISSAGWPQRCPPRRRCSRAAWTRAQLEHQGIPGRKLSTIRSSIDAEACQPQWSREQLLAEFNLPGSALVVAIVAQLIPRKGHAVLLKAWPQVTARCPDARLLVLGEGPLESDLRRQAGHDDTIRFAGFQPNLLDFVGRVDLLAHTATREGLGIAVLEAQAAGVPVVALAAGGVPEAVADGVTGLLVPADGTSDTLAGAPASTGATALAAPLAAKLADAIVTLLTDTPRRLQMGAAATAWIRDNFQADQMTGKYLALYEDLIA